MVPVCIRTRWSQPRWPNIGTYHSVLSGYRISPSLTCPALLRTIKAQLSKHLKLHRAVKNVCREHPSSGARLSFPGFCNSEQRIPLNRCSQNRDSARSLSSPEALNHCSLPHSLYWWRLKAWKSRQQTLFSGGSSCPDSREAAQRDSALKAY